MYYFIIRLLDLITAIIEDKNILLNLFQLLAEIASTFGIMIYLELIELKFLQLNYNLKKNIELRSLEEYEKNSIKDNKEDNKEEVIQTTEKEYYYNITKGQ